MPITRTAIVDDSGFGLDGTVLSNAWKTELYNQIDAMPGVATVLAPTTTGTVNNWAPGLSGNTLIRCNNATLLTITGFAAGVAGQRILLVSIGAGQVDLSHADAGSSAGNKLQNFATTGKTSLAAGIGVAEYVYDATSAVWRLVSHEQGDWITPAFAAGTYTGSASQTWTVTSGQVTTQSYWLRGRQMTVTFSLDATTVGGTPSTGLQIGAAAWGGFTVRASQFNAPIAYLLDNSANAPGFLQINSGGTVIRCLKQNLGNWTASTTATTVYGQITFGVT